MKRFFRFFTTGPGILLIVIVVGIGVARIIARSRDKAQSTANQNQAQRPVGTLKPSIDVDKATAPKEVILAQGKLNPVQQVSTVSEQPIKPVPVQQRTQPLPTLVSFYAQVQATPNPTPEPEQHKAKEIFLPRGVFIPCALVNTVESSHINTPVVGEVIRDVWQNGNLIIPAGTMVTSWAQPGAVRDRIEVAGKWSLTYPDGREFEIEGVACDREADIANQQFGIEDGSAGLQGTIEVSDHWTNAKALLGLLMTATIQAGTAAANSAVQPSHTSSGVQLPDTTPILSKYIEELLNGETGDGRFIRVLASKEFYIFPATVVEPTKRSIGARNQREETAKPLQNLPSDPLQQAVSMEKEIIKASQPSTPSDETKPHFKY